VDGRGRIALTDGEEVLIRSINLILGTVKGERRMRPQFGSGVQQYMFEPNNEATFDVVRHEVMESLGRWEPRITVQDVVVGPDPVDAHKMLIQLTYVIKATNDRRNLVYPFYNIISEP
jgi:phage baseplate assembly protein W